MDFFSSKKKEINEAIESDAIFLAERVCLEQKILLPWQRDVKALELYFLCVTADLGSTLVDYSVTEIFCS